MDKLIEDYLNLIQPKVLISKMTDIEFNEWLKIDLLEDPDMYLESLKLTLKAFEHVELYEQCILIKEKIEKTLGKTKKEL